MAATPTPTQIAGQTAAGRLPPIAAPAAIKRNAGDDRAGGVVEDSGLQALLLTAAMEIAAPGDERCPDRKRPAERP